MPVNALTPQEEADLTPGLTGGQADTTPAATTIDGSPSYSQDQGNVAYGDPTAAARAWMSQNGINPNAANPVIQSMLRSGHGAARQFDLSTNLQGTGTEFMDFIDRYMGQRNTPGAGPMFSKDEIDKMIASAMQQAMTHSPDGLEGNPWQQFFGNYTSAQAQTAGHDDVQRPDEQADFMKRLLWAYQDVSNPFAQQARQSNVDQQLSNWQTDMLAPGKTAENQVPSFVAWLMSNGGVPGQGAQ